MGAPPSFLISIRSKSSECLTNNFDPEYGNYNGGMITDNQQVGKQHASWQRLRVLPQYGSGCEGILRSDPLGVQAEPVWRHDRRPR